MRTAEGRSRVAQPMTDKDVGACMGSAGQQDKRQTPIDKVDVTTESKPEATATRVFREPVT